MSEETIYLETTCLHYKEKFLLNWMTVDIKRARYDDDDDEVRIHCPHCKTNFYPI